MEQKIVRRLEKEIEDGLVEVVDRLGLKRLPLMPSRLTMHLMAKAAVTVYETAVENHHERPDE